MAALAAGAGGCGDDSATTSDSIAMFTSPPLSKKEYLKQSNALCEQAEKQRNKSLEAAAIELEKSNGTYTQLIEEDAIPQIRQQIEDLARQTPPEADAERIEKMLGQMTVALEESEEDAKKFENDEPFAAANRSAAAYGLTACQI